MTIFNWFDFLIIFFKQNIQSLHQVSMGFGIPFKHPGWNNLEHVQSLSPLGVDGVDVKEVNQKNQEDA